MKTIFLVCALAVMGAGIASAQDAAPSPASRTPLGFWGWFNGKVVEFRADGQTEASDGMQGRWTGGNAVQVLEVRWNDGPIDQLVLSRDGRQLRWRDRDHGVVAEWIASAIAPSTKSIIFQNAKSLPAKPGA